MWGRTSSVERGNSPARAGERLAERRRLRRRRGLIAFFILLLLLLAVAIYEFNQNAVRISRVQIFGADQSLADIATQAMQGSYLGIIPRDSFFFFPASRIRAELLAAHPEFAAISIFRNGLTGLTIKIDNRVPVARWCGLAPTEGVEEYCYLFDVKGYIFGAAATTTQTINPFIVYAPLVDETLEPLRATVANADKLPSAFDFARQLATLGSPVEYIVFRADEVDDYLASGTRVTYVLGDEQDAFTALVSARENLNLTDGSLDYVDVRFDGKVYLKKKSDTVTQ
ncbi:MAG: hypothetical protein Q8O94_01465 [bacterium]|nr:hypothetical protein [bacterium]